MANRALEDRAKAWVDVETLEVLGSRYGISRQRRLNRSSGMMLGAEPNLGEIGPMQIPWGPCFRLGIIRGHQTVDRRDLLVTQPPSGGLQGRILQIAGASKLKSLWEQ